MLLQRKQRYLLSAFIFLFLLVGTLAGLLLLKHSQDTRQQASETTCQAGDPYCSCNLWGGDCVLVDPNGAREIVESGSTENNRGIVSTSFTGQRPTTESACGGVWMNDFCYMPGDEIAGGYIVVDSGKYNYPYLEKKEVYESISFGSETVNNRLGTTQNLGDNCGGKGLNIDGICYAFGAVVNGYLVIPDRTTGCNNSTGDYCYAHLKKIEVAYDDWQAAVGEYEATGNYEQLEELYRRTYGISFQPGSLYDANASNADLLRAQTLISSLTSATVIQDNARAENTVLEAKGTLTAEEQATYDFNRRIIEYPDLAKHYQILDQLNGNTSQKIAINNAISQMYSDLVTTEDETELNALANAKFKEIFGYDPGSKYGNLNGVLGALGIDPAQLSEDRDNYTQAVAEAIEEQNQNVEEINQEYQAYVSGQSENINDLKQAALDAGVITESEIANLSETDLLALLLSKFSDISLTEAQQNADEIVSTRNFASQEQTLTQTYIDNQQNGASNQANLAALYELYVGSAPTSAMSASDLQKEIAKHNSQVALSLYAQTQDVSYLNNYYINNSSSTSLEQFAGVVNNPKVLLTNIYGSQLGGELYQDIVLPNKFNEAVANFSNDTGASLISVCKEMGITNCNIDSTNATVTLSLMLDKMYGDQGEVNIPELATNYSNQIYATVKEDEAAEFWDTVFANFAAAKVAENTGFVFSEDSVLAQNLTSATSNQLVQMQEYSTAVDAGKIFNASQAFTYATENRADLSDYTWGLSYGNALMADNIFNREFSIDELGLDIGQTVGLTFNQVTSQLANVDVAQNIATNYATSKYYDYTGPADTNIANIALSGAEQLGVLDYNYQEAQAGYYLDKTLTSWGESIGEAMTYLGASYASSQMNQVALNQSLYSDDNSFEFVDPITYAQQASAEFKATYHQDMLDDLYEEYIAVADTNNVTKLSFEQFLNDPEVQRSSQELNYERLEKVVAPVAAVVVLPVMLVTGVGTPLLLGAASSAFSLYQGAGMKAQALELQRIDITSRENAIVQSYVEGGASAQEITDLRAELDLQVETLNKQGNLMLANSAVAALTSAGGWATSLANAGQLTNTISNVALNSGQILTKMGQIGGIGLNTYNTVNSGITAYNAFAEGNILEGITSATGAFVSASGVAGNTFGVLGPTTFTNKVDYILDALNVPAGAGMDLQQVSQACFSSSDAFSEKDCTNAWIGLALSAGQNVSQISSSYKNYRNDTDTARITDLQKQLDAIDVEILALSGQRNITAGLTINDLVLQRLTLVEQISNIDSNLQIARSGLSEDDLIANSTRFSLDLENQAQRAIDNGQDTQALYLLEQATILRNNPAEIVALNKDITAIDEQITKRGLLLSAEERTALQQERSSLLTKLETVAAALPDVESLRKQSAIIVQTAKADTANQELNRLLALDTQKAELVIIYSPRSEEVANYRAELSSDGHTVKLETDANRRLLSLSVLEDSVAKLNDLEGQRQALLNTSNAESEVGKEAIVNLDAEIAPLQKIVEGLSVDNRSVLQKVADAISPNRDSRNAYHQALDLTRQAETIKTKLTDSNLSEVDTANLKNQLAEINHRLMEQKYVLAQEVANPSRNVVQRIADIVPNWQNSRQIADLKSAAKKLGVANLEIAEQISSKQAEIERLRVADADVNQAEIIKLENEITDLSQTARNLLKGTNALIKVDQSAEFTKYLVTDAGVKAGIKQKQLDILNSELENFESFRRKTQSTEEIEKYGLFKIYSGTESFKDQDIFLLAEVEAFGAGRRGTVFGALPGMGKTDVVMPFNILLKQRLTNEPQFIVFPEPKLMKPWTSDASYTPNKAFIDYVEANFGKGSVVIVKANDSNVDPAAIAQAKFVITTKDVAFDLQNTTSRVGLALRNKWRNSYVHADEVDWTFNPNENYRVSGQQVALRDKPEFALYLSAQKNVLGIDENGSLSGRGLSSLRNLINQLETSKSIPEGIVRTSDGKGGKFADVELEKQVLSEWLATWGGQNKIPDLDMSADISVVREKINTYLSTDSDAQTHSYRTELAMINETVNFLSRVPGEDYGLSSNTRLNGDVEEIINSIAPKEQNRDTGRSYSAVAESLLYNTLGARILGVNNQIDLAKLTVGENGSEINYALLMLESKGFSLYTGTPETVAKLYEMAYGIELKVFTDSAVDDSIARFKKSDSALFTDLEAQIIARLAENRDQVFINMVSGLRSNEVALSDLVNKLSVVDTGNQKYKKLMLIGAGGKLTEYDVVDGNLQYVRDFVSTDDLNSRTAELNDSNERYIKFYEYGAHVGVDTKNKVDVSRAIGLCNGCDATTFAQGINRVRVQVETLATGGSVTKAAPMDIVWLDAPAGNKNPGIDDFASAIKDRQTINEALAEVSFKETLLRNSVDATFADLVELARNGKKGFLGLGAYQDNQNLVVQLEAAQQKWKETSQMNYMLGSDDLSAQSKLSKTASQVAGAYEELNRLLVGSGEPARLLAKRADGALGDSQVKLVFSGDDNYKVLGERPSYRQIVDLINQSSKHLENVDIAFTNRSSQTEVVQSEMAKAADSVSAENAPRTTTQEVAQQNVVQETAASLKQRFNANTWSKVLRTPATAISSAFSSAYNALTNLFSKEEIPAEVLAQRYQTISDLKVSNPQTLARLESFKTAAEITNFVEERQALYEKLKNQFTTLNTARPTVNNEEDYQAQEEKFNALLVEIKDLQARSGLVFVEIATDGTLSRVNEDQFKNLSTFRAKAEVQAEKLAKAATEQIAAEAEQVKVAAAAQKAVEQERLEAEKLAKAAEEAAEKAKQLAAAEAEKAKLEQEAAQKAEADRLAQEKADKAEQEKLVQEEEDNSTKKESVQEEIAQSDFINEFNYQPINPEENNIPNKSVGEVRAESNKQATSYRVPGSNFDMVDIEHYAWARKQLKSMVLGDRLLQVAKLLSIDTNGKDISSIYQEINKKFVDREFLHSKQLSLAIVVDAINGDTYKYNNDNRYDNLVEGQNSSPRQQTVFEAVANSIDAILSDEPDHEATIGQFGKGIKQALTWLSSGTEDRIEIFCREPNSQPYKVTIIKDSQGQYYVQTTQINLDQYLTNTNNSQQGTNIKIFVEKGIPVTQNQVTTNQYVSQEEIISGLHKRYPFITNILINTKRSDEADSKHINGYVTKQQLIPHESALTNTQRADGTQRTINVTFTENTIEITDNGKGMNAQVIADMFVPQSGTKHPEPLSGDAVQQELKKVKAVYDFADSSPKKLSLARNGEVIMALDMPRDIIQTATVDHNFMLDGARLFDVADARDAIKPDIPQLNQVSNFQEAIAHVVVQISENQNLETSEKLKFINTIAVGLDQISTDANAKLLLDIKKQIRDTITPLIIQLEQDGVAFFPHFTTYEKIAIPKGKSKIIYLDPDLFNWLGIADMKKLGAKQVPGIYFGNDQDIPLLMMDFKPEYTDRLTEANNKLVETDPYQWLQVLVTDSYIVIPTQFGRRLAELAEKFNKDALTEAENLELKALAQAINIHTAAKVVTSYETVKLLDRNANLVKFEVEEGQIDSEALLNFLQPKEKLLIKNHAEDLDENQIVEIKELSTDSQDQPSPAMFDLIAQERQKPNEFAQGFSYLGKNNYLYNIGNSWYVENRSKGNDRGSALIVKEIIGNKYIGVFEHSNNPGIFNANTGEYESFSKDRLSVTENGEYRALVDHDGLDHSFVTVQETKTDTTKTFYVPGPEVVALNGTSIFVFGNETEGFSFFDAEHELRNQNNSISSLVFKKIIPGPHYLILENDQGKISLYHFGNGAGLLETGRELPEGEIDQIDSDIGIGLTAITIKRKSGFLVKNNLQVVYLDELTGQLSTQTLNNLAVSKVSFSYNANNGTANYHSSGPQEINWQVPPIHLGNLVYKDSNNADLIIYKAYGYPVGSYAIDPTTGLVYLTGGTIAKVKFNGMRISEVYSFSNGDIFVSVGEENFTKTSRTKLNASFIFDSFTNVIFNEETGHFIYKDDASDDWKLFDPEKGIATKVTIKNINLDTQFYGRAWVQDDKFVFYDSSLDRTVIYDSIQDRIIERKTIAADYANANTVEELITALRTRGKYFHSDGSEHSVDALIERIETVAQLKASSSGTVLEASIVPFVYHVTRTDGLATRLAMILGLDGAEGLEGYLMPNTLTNPPDYKDYSNVWNEQVIGKNGVHRDKIVSQAQTVYQTLLKTLPEDIQNDKKLVSELSRKLTKEYSLAEQDLFNQFLQDPERFEFSDSISHSLLNYTDRLNHLSGGLSEFITQLESELVGQAPQLRRELYRNLIGNIFTWASSDKVSIDTSKPVNNNFYYGLAYGWQSESSQEVFDATNDIGKFVKEMNSLGIYQAEVQKLITALRASFDANHINKSVIIRKQIQRFLELGNAELFIDMLTKFKKVNPEAIKLAISPEKIDPIKDGGDIMPFIYFLTNDASLVREENQSKMNQSTGEEIGLPRPISIPAIQKLERLRIGSEIMSVEDLVEAISSQQIYSLDLSDEQSQADLAELLKNISVQRESGAYTGEVAQNSYDATKTNIEQGNIQKGELIVDFYTAGNEYIEEMTDNGTGAINPLSLLIPKSDKQAGAQTTSVGFFGTGKFTIYEGVDRVEIITSNGEQAIKFSLRVTKDEFGKAQNVVLYGLTKLDAQIIPRGVTVRRIKDKTKSLPELESMIAQRSWKTFAGLTQGEAFEIRITNGYKIQDGQAVPEINRIQIDNLETLSETKLKVSKRDSKADDLEFIEGTVRTYEADDMPLQIVDRIGLRVVEYKDPYTMSDEEWSKSYFALIPKEYLPHFKELGLIIQIPLPLNRDRKSFANEDFYIKEIQKYVAISFVKSLAYKRLNYPDSFTFYGFAEDSLENIGNYSQQFNPDKNPQIAKVKEVAELINTNQTNLINMGDLIKAMTMNNENIVNLTKLLLVKDRDSSHQISLFTRRLNYLMEIDRQQAERELKYVYDKKSQYSGGTDIMDLINNSGGNEVDKKTRVATGKSIVEGHDQMNHPERYAVAPSNVQEKTLLEVATLITKLLYKDFRIDEVRLVEGTSFAGAFNFDDTNLFEKFSNRKRIMYLNKNLAYKLGQSSYGGTMIDATIDTIIHELSHALEDQIDGTEYSSSMSSHQAIGRFADAMKYLSGRVMIEYDQWLIKGGVSFEDIYRSLNRQEVILLDSLQQLIRDINNRRIVKLPADLIQVLEEGTNYSQQELKPVLQSLRDFISGNKKLKEYEERLDSISNQIGQFSSLCSDCNQVRLDTQAGVMAADALMQEAAELTKQADAARIANNQAQATDLSKQARAKQQAALDQLNQTRFQVVNSHGMQNQCVQLYLNAWVDTREAEIRKTKADVNNAIDSVYKATVLAEKLLTEGKMEITTKPGFLGIGRKTESIDLSPEELSDINNLLVGNAKENITGLKAMAEFEETEQGLDKNKIIGGSLKTLKQAPLGKSPITHFFNQVRILRTEYETLLRKNFTQSTAQNETNNHLQSYVQSVLDLDKNYNLIPLTEEIALNSTDHIKDQAYKKKEEILSEIKNILNGEHYNTRFLSKDDEMVKDIQNFVDKLIDLINQERVEAGKEPLPKAQIYVSLNQELNAFALPDGSIVVHQGLINALRTKDQLFAILAHEVSHFEDKFLDWNNLLNELTSGRAEEYKADTTTLLRLGKLGYQPKAFQGAAEILNNVSNIRTNSMSFWEQRGVDVIGNDEVYMISDLAHGSLFNRNINLEMVFNYQELGIAEDIKATEMPSSWRKSTNYGFLHELISSSKNQTWEKIFTMAHPYVKKQYYEQFMPHLNNIVRNRKIHIRDEYGDSQSSSKKTNFYQKLYSTILFQQTLSFMNQELQKFNYVIESFNEKDTSLRDIKLLWIASAGQQNNWYETIGQFFDTMTVDAYLGSDKLFFRVSPLFFKIQKELAVLKPNDNDLNSQYLEKLADSSNWSDYFGENKLSFTIQPSSILSYIFAYRKYTFEDFRYSSLMNQFEAIEEEFNLINGIYSEMNLGKAVYSLEVEYYLMELVEKLESNLLNNLDQYNDDEQKMYWDKLLNLMMQINGVSNEKIFNKITKLYSFGFKLSAEKQVYFIDYLNSKLNLNNKTDDLIDFSFFRGISNASDQNLKKNLLTESIINLLINSDKKSNLPDILAQSLNSSLLDVADKNFLKETIFEFALNKASFKKVYTNEANWEARSYELAQKFLIAFYKEESFLELNKQLQVQYFDYLQKLIHQKGWSTLSNYFKNISGVNKKYSLDIFSDFAIIQELQKYLNELEISHINQNISGFQINYNDTYVSRLTVADQLRWFIALSTDNFTELSNKKYYFGGNELEANLLKPLVSYELNYFEEKSKNLHGLDLYNFFEAYYPSLDNKDQILETMAAKLFTELSFDEALDFLKVSLQKGRNQYIHFFLENHVRTLEEYKLVSQDQGAKQILNAQNNGLAMATFFDFIISNYVTNIDETSALGFFEAAIRGDHEKVKYYLAKYYSSMLSFSGDSSIKKGWSNFFSFAIKGQRGVFVDDNGEINGPGAVSFPTFNEFVSRFYGLSKLEKTAFLSKLLSEKLLLNESNHLKIATLLTDQLEDSEEINLKPLLKNIVRSTLSQVEGSTKIQLGISRALADTFLQGNPQEVSNDYAVEAMTNDAMQNKDNSDKNLDAEKVKHIFSNLLNQNRDIIKQQNSADYQFIFDLNAQAEALASRTLDSMGIVETKTENFTANTKIPVGRFITELAKSLGSLGVRFLQVFGQYFDLPKELQEEFLSVYDDASNLYMTNLFQSAEAAIVALQNSKDGASTEEINYNLAQANKLKELLPNLKIVKKIGGGSINTTYLVEIKNPQNNESSRKVLKISNPNVIIDVANVGNLVRSVVSDLTNLDNKNEDNYQIVQRLMHTLEQWNTEDIQDKNFLKHDPLFKEFYPYQSSYGFDFNTSNIADIYNRWIKIEDYVEGNTLKNIISDFESQVTAKDHDVSVQDLVKAKRIEELISDITADYVKHLNQVVILEDGSKAYVLHSDLHIGNVMADEDLSKVSIIDRSYYLVFSQEEVDLIKALLSNKQTEISKFTSLTKYLLDSNQVKEQGFFSYWKTYTSYLKVAFKEKFIKRNTEANMQISFFNAMMQETDRLGLEFPLNIRLFAKNMAAIDRMLSRIGDDNLGDYLSGTQKTEYDGGSFLKNINIDISDSKQNQSINGDLTNAESFLENLYKKFNNQFIFDSTKRISSLYFFLYT